MKTVGIVLSGGSGKRMGTELPKQYLKVGGYPVLYYSLAVMQKSFLDEIVLVAAPEWMDYCREELVERYHLSKVTKIVAGGAERYDSVACGLEAAGEADVVFIHDGARPCIDEAMLARGLEKCLETGACVAAVPSKDTVKIVAEDGRIEYTPPRSTVWAVQTPQVFSLDLVRRAYRMLAGQDAAGITDDAMVVEKMLGLPVYVYEGSYRNIKITTPEDLLSAERFLADA